MLFDIAPSEMLLTAVLAVVFIGPKDMPRALRTAGKWIGKMRRVSGHFRSGIENIIREAELEEMEQKWREQNEAIMKAHPTIDPAPAGHLLAGEPAPTEVPAPNPPVELPPPAEPTLPALPPEITEPVPPLIPPPSAR